MANNSTTRVNPRVGCRNTTRVVAATRKMSSKAAMKEPWLVVVLKLDLINCIRILVRMLEDRRVQSLTETVPILKGLAINHKSCALLLRADQLITIILILLTSKEQGLRIPTKSTLSRVKGL